MHNKIVINNTAIEKYAKSIKFAIKHKICEKTWNLSKIWNLQKNIIDICETNLQKN